MVLFQTKHTKIEYHPTFTKRMGKKNALYIIKECEILSHPGADTPLEIPLDQPDNSKKLKWLVLSTILYWPDML